MSLTIANKRKFTVGGGLQVTAQITFDSSYPSGGESLTPGQLGLKKIDQLQAEPDSGYVFEYNYTTEKLLAYRVTPVGTAVFTNSGSTSTFTNSGSTFADSGSTSQLSLTGLSGATVEPAYWSGTVLGTSGAAAVVVPHSGQITTVAKGTVTAAGTIATTAAGTIAFTGTAGAMAQVTEGVNLGTVVTKIVAIGR